MPAEPAKLLRPGAIRRHVADALLLPVAILVVIVEDVVWSGAHAVLRAFCRFAPVRALSERLGRLSGYQALPLFLVPEVFGRVGEIWAIALLVGGYFTSGVTVYVLVRLAATLLAVYVYRACEPALLRIRWFATGVRWIGLARDWALGVIRPMRARVHAWVARAPGTTARRFAAMRAWLETRWLKRLRRHSRTGGET